MTRLAIPAHLRDRQRLASDPARSIWVSANAGSGKTHVLTQRVIRLLLGGVAPARILCLTFTKAAAAQMSQRVFATLSEWSTMDDAPLRAAIVETGAPNPTAPDFLLARRLFTRTIETPGGLKIQTIHAFCERMLHLFPFEANVPARFEVADELRMAELMAHAKRAAVAAAQRSEGEPGVQLALVADLAGASGIDDLLNQAIARRAAARRAGRSLQETLAERLGATGFASVDAVRAAMVDGGLPPARWDDVAAIMATGLRTDQELADRFGVAARAEREGSRANLAQILDAYLPIFFTGKGERRKAMITGALGKAHPAIKTDLEAEQARLEDLQQQLKIAEAVERTEALLALADDVRRRYDHAKGVAGLLDFDDLIERTLRLLEQCDTGWVLRKLDAGIDHILVDEAQDTSEAQWKILERLTGDFASGAGAGAADRSVFVVGDDKQSIFSFQGAAPLMFDAMRSAFERRFRAGAKPFERVTLNTSFRSVPGILDAVDGVFESASHQDGLVRTPDVWPRHESVKNRLPSLVEIWPRVQAEAAPDPRDWSIPLDTAAERDPPNVVADRVARKIRQLTAPESVERVHDGRGETPRAIRPGDVLVLVRTRGAFFEAVIRALKQQRVPVAGADRLDVAQHIAVKDLVAAGRSALLPRDDLSLACLLKSPLFGFTDDDLIALAPRRPGPLFAALGASASPHHQDARAMILGWSARASAVTPFVFYLELLGRDGGRRRMEARLGPEAHDAIDEFLRLALTHEQLGAPALGAFLDDVEALETTVKRDMEGPGDEVRVMTVHAAKGLEAKIVFLPDTCAVPAQSFDPVVFDLNKDTGLPPVIVWSPRKSDDPAAVAAVRAAERQATMREYRRLLYVALTRAEERLYVAGFHGTREPPADCWNTMINDALSGGEAVPAFWDSSQTVRRITTTGDLTPTTRGKPVREQGALGLVPTWLTQPVGRPRAAVRALRPSTVADPGGTGPGGAETDRTARRRALDRGSAVHMLLQTLPDVAPEARVAAGLALLQGGNGSAQGDTPRDDATAILAEVLAVLAVPALAPLFAPPARAEVAVHGRLRRLDGVEHMVDGTVDRLVVTPEAVILADFKSGAPQADPPAAYRDQIALYRRVLQPLWPNRDLRAFLVWTREPRVVALDADMLDRAADALLAQDPGADGALP